MKCAFNRKCSPHSIAFIEYVLSKTSLLMDYARAVNLKISTSQRTPTPYKTTVN